MSSLSVCCSCIFLPKLFLWIKIPFSHNFSNDHSKYIPLKFQCIILGIFLPQVFVFQIYSVVRFVLKLFAIHICCFKILEIKSVMSECFFFLFIVFIFNLSHVFNFNAFLDATGFFRIKQALKQTSKTKVKLKTKKFYLNVFHERRFSWGTWIMEVKFMSIFFDNYKNPLSIKATKKKKIIFATIKEKESL